MKAGGEATGWRPWDRSESGTVAIGRPLRDAAPVQNRWFPKTRSWFALGAPLELLSPLSLARILVLLAAVWPAMAVLTGYPVDGRWVLAVSSAGAITSWLLLLRSPALSRRSSRSLCAVLTTASAVVAIAGRGSPGADAALLFWGPLGAYSALFAGTATLITETVVLGVTTGVVAAAAGSDTGATGLAVAAVLALLALAVTLRLCAHAARQRGMADPDTGLPNGFGLAQRLPPGAGPLVVTVSVLSGLAEAREALGYVVGTEVLQRAVENLGQAVPAGVLIGRIEGDEIVVIQTLDALDARREESLVAARQRADGLVAEVVTGLGAGSYVAEGIELTLQAHVGVALMPWDGDELSELVRKAAVSARRAAASLTPSRAWGGDEELLSGDDLALLAELQRADAHQELWLAFQPQVSVQTGGLVGVEALLRWQSPQRGAVPPSRFITLAERTGLIARLTQWALAEALDAQARWVGDGLDIPISINLSAVLVGRPGLAARIGEELARRNLPGRLLTIEVTETAEAADLLAAARTLGELRELGITVSLDDFGTGYTSMAALPDLPFNELKIDQTFVRRSRTSAADEAIVLAAAHLGRRLGYHVVAEGVEDEATARHLAGFGIDTYQGFHFARPMPEADLLRWVRAARPASPAHGALSA